MKKAERWTWIVERDGDTIHVTFVSNDQRVQGAASTEVSTLAEAFALIRASMTEVQEDDGLPALAPGFGPFPDG